MTADELVSALALLGGFDVRVGGSWVDALVGRQTRHHSDPDLLDAPSTRPTWRPSPA